MEKTKEITSPKADILLVDDTPENLRILTQILNLYGYKTRAVSDGKQALKEVQSALPDLIMMDINMPEMDGYETCLRLKKDEKTRPIPVIFISALDDTEDKIRAFEVGGVDYITKPFQVEEVMMRLETHLSIRRLQSELEAANLQLSEHLSELSQLQAAEREQRILAETLVETIAAINSSLDYNEVLDLILANMARVVPHETSNIALIYPGKRVKILRERGYEAHFSFQEQIKSIVTLDQMPTWRKAFQTRQPVIIQDTRQESEWMFIPGLEWVRSYACIPITSKGSVMGFLNLDSAEPDFFKPHYAMRMISFADQAAVAIEKARLFKEVQILASMDGLTGVLNRRRLLEISEREFQRALRYQHPLAALMIDLDNFKIINDTFGHPMGDQALIALAQSCQKQLRSSDLFGRYGGEEFLALLPETPHEKAMEVAERLRQKIEKIAIQTEKGLIQFTASIGVATLTGETELDALIINSDDALYRAKAKGRNQVSD
jgi:diguanylate cyclase (GGDEF)-like protein